MTFEEFKTKYYNYSEINVSENMNILEKKEKEKEQKAIRKRAFLQIKAEFTNFKELLSLVNECEKKLSNSKNLLYEAIVGENPLPKTYNKLGLREPSLFTDSIEQELNWIAIGLLKYADILNQFLKLRSDFLSNLLTGNYSKARIILNKIEYIICVSLWSIEQRFILDEYEKSSEKNWETRNLVLDEGNQFNVRVFGEFCSAKAEKQITVSQYNEFVNYWVKKGVDDSHKEYIRFYLNHFSLNSYQHFPDIYWEHSIYSIIDLYLHFIRLAQHLMSKSTNEYDFLSEILLVISKKIPDIAIKQMLIVKGKYSFRTNELNKEVLDCLDQYTLGNYDKVLFQCKQYISSKYGNIIELYEIYAKSLIELNLPFERLNENDSFNNLISEAYYNILSKNHKTTNSFVDLIKIAYTFNNEYIGFQIYRFVCEELGWTRNINYKFISELNSQFINPRLLDVLLEDSITSKKVLDNFSKNIPLSFTIKGYKADNDYLLNGKIYNLNFIPVIKQKLYYARLLYYKQDFENAKNIYEEIFHNENLSSISKYEIITKLYACYWFQESYRNCINLYVSSFLNCEQLVLKLNKNSLTDIIILNKFKNIGELQNLIELPILFKITLVENQKIYWAYRVFLNSHDLDRPSKLNIHIFDKHKLIYFLNNVCIPNVLERSHIYNSPEDVYNERIKICQLLVQIDPENIEIYNKEIDQFTLKNGINKVVKQIDEGKIYVNDAKLKLLFTQSDTKTDNKDLSDKGFVLNKNTYHRYINLMNFVENNEFKETKALFSKDDNNDFPIDQSTEKIFYPAWRLLLKMFLELRDSFLFNSEYGLEVYLSTLIRHGTLPNKIRSVFEERKLITTQNEGIYLDNENWKEKYLHLSEDKQSHIQQCLSSFSQKIDDISNQIRVDWIQIKTENKTEKESALFDFQFSNWDLWNIVDIYKNNKDLSQYEAFIDDIIKELWNKTEICLEIIRSKIENDLESKYITIINELQESLTTNIARTDISELHTNIQLCRTNIQNELINISKWFKKTDHTFQGTLDLSMLIEVSIDRIRNLNPNANFELSQDIQCSIEFKGQTISILLEVIKILLENMISKSGLSGKDINARVIAKKSGDNLYLCFENSLSENISIPEIEYKLSETKEGWCNKSFTEAANEKHSGLHKIKKMLFSDLSRKEDSFDFEISDFFVKIHLQFETNGLKI